MSRNERRAMRKEGHLDETAFLKVADRFIDVANKENEKYKATELHLAMLFASARYSAYVANIVLSVDEHEPFVEHMVKQYSEMLRQHLADPNLAGAGADPDTPLN
ncbi:DUF3144 domain-containing protein [Tepidamorphus sp. 3E244]|uniref:DUF3144 domain-containing protein n=1 Tax=Tepidamorphus sp. 3E244 TaxID=3385498 RepID=UPI0038FC8BDA